MWSFVFSKENQRWLWLALDHQTGQILAYTFGRRKDEVFRSFQRLLAPFNITVFYTDDWGSYQRNIQPQQHVISKKNTQTIERKNLTLRTHIKRLCRKSICFSKSVIMHDIVIGLLSTFGSLDCFILSTTLVVHNPNLIQCKRRIGVGGHTSLGCNARCIGCRLYLCGGLRMSWMLNILRISNEVVVRKRM